MIHTSRGYSRCRLVRTNLDDRVIDPCERCRPIKIWTGESQRPERFGIILRLWLLLISVNVAIASASARFFAFP
jgi:hypothetical protein